MSPTLFSLRPSAIASKNRRRRKRAQERRNPVAIVAEVPRVVLTQGEKRVAEYRRYLFRGKVKFAVGGYRFQDDLETPAVEIFSTNIRTIGGRDRGIRVGNAMPYLPAGFVLFFSWHSESRNPTWEMPQCMYQIEVPGRRHLMLDTEPEGQRGLANFINAAVDVNERHHEAYREALLYETSQDKRKFQCKIMVANSKVGKINLLHHPVYVTVLHNVPAGDELLLPKRYGSGRGYNMPMP